MRHVPEQSGFSLLEVLVAVSILGLGLTAILSAQAGAFASASHARHVSQAVGLLRCRMTEIEEHLYRDGFQETDESGTGACCEGDDSAMRCAWRVERPTFPEARFGDLNLSAGLNLTGSGSAASGGLGALGLLSPMNGSSITPLAGAGSLTDVAKTLADANAQLTQSTQSMAPPVASGSVPSGSGVDPTTGGAAGMGGLASMAMSLVYPGLKLLFEASTRRITVTITFREGKKEHAIDLVQWFCVPQKGLASDDQAAAAAAASGRP